MRVLVTGGAGYLGCHLVPLLLEKGHSVRVFDRLCFGEDPIASYADSPRCEVIKGDIRKLSEFPTLLDDIDGIVHLAGLANDPSCDLDTEMAMDVNLGGSKDLARLAVEKGIKRFVLASSCSVYGKGVFDLLDEESPTSPVSVYGLTKLEAERALLSLKSPTFDPVALRSATLFGWSSRMRFDLAINAMTGTACRDGRVTVMGGGKQWRPFVHVNDAARAFLMMLEAPSEKVSGEIFNVGSDDANLRIVDLATEVVGQFDGVDLEVASEDDDLRTYNVQFGKIRDVMGFECEKSISDGVLEIREAIYENNVDPFAEQYFNVRRLRHLLEVPVDEGGEPVAPHFIPLARPSMGEEEISAVTETVRSGWMTTGVKVATFEEDFASAVGAPYAVALSSCTAAIHLSLIMAGLEPGDEVISSPLTFASTANTIVNMGAIPVFVDISPETLNMDPDALEAAITDKTKVIVPVHLAGQPCDLDAINEIAQKHGIAIIEDSAHALGASYKDKPIGGGKNPACFSFYPIKNITTVEGGIATAKTEEEADMLRVLANHGMTKVAWDRYSPNAVTAPTEVVELGFKYRMHDVAAAMGIEQLKKLPSFIAARRRLAKLYNAVLSDIEEITLPKMLEDVSHSWHLLIIRLKLDKLRKSRDEIAAALRLENIGTGIHFYSLHLHKYYRERFGFVPEDLPNAAAASHDILSLPLYPGMTDKHVHQVVEALKKVLAHSLS